MQRLMILVAVFVTMTARASAQDLYTCKTPEGRTVISNVPCAGGSDETVIPSAVPAPRPVLAPRAVPAPPPAPEEQVPRPPVTSNPTVDAAFKALRKLMAATEVGITMSDYGQLVVDAKAAVNDVAVNTATHKDASMQKEIEAAMHAYADALTAWNLSLQDRRLLKGYSFFVGDHHAEGTYLNTKYRLLHQSSGVVDKRAALSTMWKAAKTHLTRATELAK